MTVSQALDLASRSPHTFTIQYPPSRHYFRQRFASPITDALPWWQETCAHIDEALLYVHIPFCAQRCFYCNFAVDVRRNEDLHERYISALTTQLQRLHARWPHDRLGLSGVDIGGGTPTHISTPLLERVLIALKPWLPALSSGAQLSIETTPRVAAHHPEKLALLRQGGVTRVSMGLQSTNDETLASVNRRQQRTLATQSLSSLTQAGFSRTSVDLVFGLPGQTIAHFRQDLREVIAHGVDAITIYDCLYRGEGRALPSLTSQRPSPQDYAGMYNMAFELLLERGYRGHYGSVNFSRHAHEEGTSSYFTNRLLRGHPYVGVGNYSSSLTREGRWWFAPYEVDEYITCMAQPKVVLPTQGGAYELPAREHMAKHLLANLNFGILEASVFKNLFGDTLERCFPDALALALERRWLEPCAEGYAVVHGAFEQMYACRALFYTPGALDWVETHLDLCQA